jgi:hypothetical protein
VREDGLIEGIHETDRTAVFVEVGAVVDDIFDLSVVEQLFGFFPEPIILDLMDLELAIA